MIAAGDAETTTAADLNTINGKTSEAVSLTNVTELAGSVSALETLADAIDANEFSMRLA